MGVMRACDRVHLGAESLSSLSCEKSHLPWLMHLLERGCMTTDFSLEDLSLGRKKEFRESFVLHFQVPTALHNQCNKASYLGMACSKLI